MTAPASTLSLKTVFNAQNPSLQPLRDGRVKIRGVQMEQVPAPNIIPMFRQQCRDLPWEISEMAVVTYFTARLYGLPMTALPIFPSSRVEEGGGIFVRKDSGIRSAKDLAGKTAGLRSWAVTPSTWGKAYLAQQGLDLGSVRWICYDDEHVAAYNDHLPKNVEWVPGANVAKMLSEGEIDAVLGVQVQGYEEIVPLVPDFRERGIERFKQDGIYRLIHLMTVRDDVLAAHPWLLEAVYEAFAASKQAYLESLGAEAPKEPWEDPLPTGLKATRSSLERLMLHAIEQSIIPAPLDLDEIFPGNFE
jgi:4,5-dihydroxyphthalate decarboxylase